MQPLLARWVELIERHVRVIFLFLAVLYFVGYGALAYGSALSSDDIFSLYVSRVGSASQIVTAVLHGADTHPPLHYLLLHAAHGFFGDSDLAGRLPFLVVGFVSPSILYVYARQRFPAIYAVVAAIFLLLTASTHAALSTRPYPLMMCAYVLAFWFWQRSTQQSHRIEGLIGLAVTTALAVLTHFYGGAVTLPIAAGEAWRSWQRSRVEVGAWLAMAAGMLPMALLLPQVRSVAATIGSAGLRHPETVTSPAIGKLISTYTTSLQPGLLITLVGCLILGAILRSVKNPAGSDNNNLSGFFQEELIGAMVLILLPLLLYFLGVYSTGVYAPGYGYMASLGIAMMIPQLLLVFFRDNRLAVSVLVVGLFLTFAYQQARFAKSWRPQPWNRFQVMSLLTGKEAAGSAPIVITHVVPFLQLLHYASPDLRGRLRYLIDVEQADRFGDPSPDIGLAQLHRWSDVPVEEYGKFERTHASFLVYEWGHIKNWLVPYLSDHQAAIQVLAVDGPHRLLRVTLR